MPVPEVSKPTFLPKPSEPAFEAVSYTHLDVYKRQDPSADAAKRHRTDAG